MQRPPAVDDARPPHCRRCDARAHCERGRLGLHGHGFRERQLRGPLGLDALATITVVRVRRYRCTACGATMTVAPREVACRRLFSRSAIALAVALWAISRVPSAGVHARVSPWGVRSFFARGWSALREWIDALRTDSAFVIPADWTRRDAAVRIAHVLGGFAPEISDPISAAFIGAPRSE
jgi:hypothetical protein